MLRFRFFCNVSGLLFFFFLLNTFHLSQQESSLETRRAVYLEILRLLPDTFGQIVVPNNLEGWRSGMELFRNASDQFYTLEELSPFLYLWERAKRVMDRDSAEGGYHYSMGTPKEYIRDVFDRLNHTEIKLFMQNILVPAAERLSSMQPQLCKSVSRPSGWRHIDYKYNSFCNFPERNGKPALTVPVCTRAYCLRQREGTECRTAYGQWGRCDKPTGAKCAGWDRCKKRYNLKRNSVNDDSSATASKGKKRLMELLDRALLRNEKRWAALVCSSTSIHCTACTSLRSTCSIALGGVLYCCSCADGFRITSGETDDLLPEDDYLNDLLDQMLSTSKRNTRVRRGIRGANNNMDRESGLQAEAKR